MAKIPALSALPVLVAFSRNPHVCPVDVVNMTHSVEVDAENYSFKPKTELNAFLRKDLP